MYKINTQSKVDPDRNRQYHPLKRLLMRLSIILTILGIQLTAMASAQYITIQNKNIGVHDFLSEIKKQSGYNILFDANALDNVKDRLNVNLKKATIEEGLERYLTPLNLAYVIRDRMVVVSVAKIPLPKFPNVSIQQTISGTVKNSSGEPLAGVTVKVKDASKNVITDDQGRFVLNIVSTNDILVFSSVGYINVEIKAANNMIVEMKEAEKLLEETVVVGYGSQKKINLTGAVSSVDIDKVSNRPITNLSTALAGLSSGLQITQSGGSRPGFDGAQIRIRGQGTLNNSDPLVIIDGASGSMNDINPSDVENVSILKDASSAAIYGSRAANGVILITTRKGKRGTAKLSYQSNLAVQEVSNKMDIVSNYADFMELQNEGFRNSGLAPNFSQIKIDEWRQAGNSDPIKYPNTDWQDVFFRKKIMQNHTISANGGTDKIRYFISGNYLNNPGIIKHAEFERYSARTNLDVDLRSWLTVGVNLYGYVSQHNPNSVSASTAGDAVFGGALGTTPGMVLLHPDGRFGGMNNTEDNSGSANNNPFRRMNFYKHEFPVITNKFVPRFYGILKPVENLSIEGSYTYNYTDQQEELHLQDKDLWNFYTNTIARSGTVRTYINTFNYKTILQQMDAVARYTYDAGKLKSQIMVGASQESYKYKWIRAQKYDLLDPALSVLDAATADARILGNMTEWAMHSYFGRLNANWDDKYLFEANFRTDGSSRFAPGSNRWGFFPSFSTGWLISQEDFMKNNLWLNTLKLRASWGALGNNNTSTNYMYQPLYSPSNYILNNTIVGGFAQSVLSDRNVTWETTYVTNVGVDVGLLNNRLSGSLEYFVKNTEGILIAIPAPLVHGTSAVPSQNVAKVSNRGFEMNFDWKDRIGNVNYFVGGNLSFVKNEVTKFRGTTSAVSGTNMILEGEPINIQYVLSVDRIIQTDEDLALVQAMVDKNPGAFSSYKRPEKGDFLYRDVNGDGIITSSDRIKVGDGINPLFTYGFNFGASWNGIDFSALVQGIGKRQVYYQSDAWRYTVRHGLQISKIIADGRWYPGRTDATYPRLLENSDSRNTQPSDAYIFDKSYMRVKNIQLGYNLPKKISERLLLEKLRIYCSVENPFTFTKFIGLDPEIDTNVNYPTIKQYSFGLSLIF